MKIDPDKMLARAAFIDKQVETWKGNPDYADTLRMEAFALRFTARAFEETGGDLQAAIMRGLRASV
jgi:hypothetical protein